MGAGVPGTGMATLFYIVSAFLMPLRELVLSLQGRSSWARWRLIGRHLLVALTMTLAAYATFRYLPRLLLPPDVTIGGTSAFLVTVVLFVSYLVLTNVAAAMVPAQLQLPEPKVIDLRDRRTASVADVPRQNVAERRRPVFRITCSSTCGCVGKTLIPAMATATFGRGVTSADPASSSLTGALHMWNQVS